MNRSRFTIHRWTPTIMLLLGAMATSANNIQVANTTLTGNTGSTVQIQFDLSWENSWRNTGINNWDAAWVFVKYRSSLTGPWLHANLNITGHVAPAGSQIDPGLLNTGIPFDPLSNPVVGVFIYRNGTGSGSMNLSGAQLQWNYLLNNLNYVDIAQVQVFAIEMVYVPQGSFFLGSGGAESGAFSSNFVGVPYFVTDDYSAITVNGVPPSLYYSNTGFSGDGSGIIYSAYPKGFNAFYCMKYEVSQQGYVDFLNTLSYTQQVARTTTAPNSAAGTGALSSTNANRNGIDIQTPGTALATPAVYGCNLNGNGVYGEATDGKDIACNWLSWGDLAAYLDWSGLRPMSELEFEKASRGIITPVPDQYPWGTTSITGNGYILAAPGAANEGIASNYSTTLGNASYYTSAAWIDGPMRTGVFAAHGSNNGRVSAGASYYGIMELGGNLWERTVTVGNGTGRVFEGRYHGDGWLSYDGFPNVSYWPIPSDGLGSGYRGGAWGTAAPHLRISDRYYAANYHGDRYATDGGRGVRSAP